MLILVALAAAVLLAVGYVLQQHEAATVPPGKVGPQLLLVLVRQPIWLAGIASMVGGQLLGATALGLGSLVVVEPLLAANVLFALPIAAVASHRWLRPADWAGAVLVVGGLAVFLAGSTPPTGVDTARVPAGTWIAAGASLAGVVGVLLLIARHRAARVRAALTAAAAGTLFGLQDFLTQRSIVRVETGPSGVVGLLTSWPPWVLLAVAITGLTLAQRAFGLADLSASLPPITLAEPLCGIVLAVAVLGQPAPHRPLAVLAAGAGLAAMVAGVVILTRSPLVVDPHARRQGAGSAQARRQR